MKLDRGYVSHIPIHGYGLPYACGSPLNQMPYLNLFHVSDWLHSIKGRIRIEILKDYIFLNGHQVSNSSI